MSPGEEACAHQDIFHRLNRVGSVKTAVVSGQDADIAGDEKSRNDQREWMGARV